MTTIAFIGLGNMGGPMTANLVKAGHSVRGFDLVADACAASARAGVSIATSSAEAVEGADVIVTMLPMGEHVLAVWSEVLPHARPGALIVDSSTVDVGSARKAHAMATERGLPSLDAPVSGGTGGAAAGMLTFMCGGEGAAFAAAKPVLENMGRRIVHCGGAGAGQAAKICNNMIAAATMIATCEGFLLGEKLGLSHQALFDVLSTSSGQSWSVTSYCPVPGLVPSSPASNGYNAGFASALMLKDLKLSQGAAASVGAATPIGAAATQLYALHNAWGEGGADFSAIIHLLRGRSGEA
jgi:3-hydroxyisobutyrate dehydrogenase